MIPISIAEIIDVTGADVIQVSEADLCISRIETDSRHILFPEKTIFFALDGQYTQGHHFIPALSKKGVRVFVTHAEAIPEVSGYVLKVNNTLHALQTLAMHYRKKFAIPVIGITGSNGKTIVKEWLAQLLQGDFQVCKSPKSYNSQLGVALSVLELNDTDEIGIFEAGISTYDEIEVLEQMICPTFGIITNIGDAHHSGFNSIEDKVAEKIKLFKHVDKILYCSDYPEIHDALKVNSKAIGWGFNKDAEIRVVKTIDQLNHTKVDFVFNQKPFHFQIPFVDAASIENCLHCILASICFEIEPIAIQKRIMLLHGLSMRLEQKEGLHGCILINDSYSLDLKSLELACRFVEQQNVELNRTLIISDFGDHRPFSEWSQELIALIQKYRFNKLIAIGYQIAEIQHILPKSILFYSFINTEDFIAEHESLNLRNELILIKGARKFKLEQFFNEYSLSKHDTILEINLKSIAHNISIYKKHLNTNTKIMAVVKAAAYGSGHYEVARYLDHKGIDYLAVAYADEGIILRQKGIQCPILVMNTGTTDFKNLFENQLEPEIFSIIQLHRLIYEMGTSMSLEIHIKLDTGMHRLGFLEHEIPELIQVLQHHKQIKVVSIFSHLAASDQADFDEFTLIQKSRFDAMTHLLIQALGYKPMLHLINSSGISRHPHLQYDMVRLGIGLYGIDSDPHMFNLLEKVHTLKTRISQINEIKEGETVSYNRSGKVNKNSKIAVLSLGYADGLPRNISKHNYCVAIQKHQAPIIGVVCMDMTMVDVSHIEGVKVGDEVEIFGITSTIEQLAKAAETIPYEILCRISPRVKRLFLQD